MIKDSAIETLRIEAESVTKLIDHIDDEFERVVQCILDCRARVIITGMGKSGHVGRKIAASLASTGTPAFFNADIRISAVTSFLLKLILSLKSV